MNKRALACHMHGVLFQLRLHCDRVYFLSAASLRTLFGFQSTEHCRAAAILLEYIVLWKQAVQLCRLLKPLCGAA